MTAPAEYIATEDLIALTCADCRCTEHEAKGARPMQAAIAAFLRREAWRYIVIDRRRRLVCPACLSARENKARARRIAEWIRKKRNQEMHASRRAPQ